MERFEFPPDDPWEQNFRDIPQPSGNDVLGAGARQAGLVGVVRPVGAAARMLGDFFGSSSLSQWGADVAANASRAAVELTPLGESPYQSLMRDAVTSAGASLPALATGGVLPTLTVMGGQTYLNSYHSAREGGLGVGRAHVYSGIDAIFETATEAWSLPILFKTGMPLLKQAQSFLMRELAGEEITTVGQKMNELLQLRPEMTVQEYWQELKKAMVETAAITTVAAPMQLGAARAFSFARRLADGRTLRVEGEPPAAAAVPPTEPPQSSGGTSAPTVDVPPGGQMPLPGAPPVTKDDYQNVRPTEVPFPDIQANIDTVNKSDPQYVDPRQMPLPQETPGEIVVPKDLAEAVETVLVPEVGPDIAAEAVPVLLPDAPAPASLPPPQGLIPYYEATPEEIATSSRPDLRLYEGQLTANSGSYVRVDYHGPSDTWFIGNTRAVESLPKLFDQSGRATHSDILDFSSYETAKQYLEKSVGRALNDAAFVARQHMVLSLRDAMSTDNVLSPVQLQLYGEKLARISDKARAYRDKLELKTAALPTRDTAVRPKGTISIPDYVDLPIRSLDVVRDGSNVVQPLQSVQDLRPEEVLIAPGVNVDPLSQGAKAVQNNEKTLVKYKKIVEAWKRKYKVNVPIVLANGLPSEFSIDVRRQDSKPVYIIYLDLSAPEAERLSALAHEFGHALIFDTVNRADASVVLELTEKWLDQVNTIDPAVLRYAPVYSARIMEFINEHGGVTRFLANEVVQPYTYQSRAYSLMFHEYAADQVAQHLYDNSYWSKASPMVAETLQKIAELLKNFFDTYGRKFTPHRAFADYLDQLAGKKRGVKKTKVDAPAIVDAPGKPVAKKRKKTTEPKPQEPAPVKRPLDSEEVKERAWLIGKFKTHGMWDEATRAEIDPNGSVEGFDFDRAKELLDALGISWEFGLRPGLETVDEPDTYATRHGLMQLSMAKNFPRELRKPLRNSAIDIRNFGRMWRSTLTAVQIRKLYGDSIPAVKNFVNGLERMFAYRDSWKRRANTTLELMVEAGKEQQKQVYELLMEEDSSGTFLSKVVTTADPKAETGRKNTVEILPEAVQKYKLDAKGVRLYETMRRDWLDALDVVEVQAIDELLRNYSATDPTKLSPEKAEAVDKQVRRMQKDFAEMKAKPYYPHTRFGDYYVIVKHSSGETMFTQYESLREAETFARAMAGPEFKVRVGEMREEVKPLMNMPFEVFNMLKAELNLTQEQIDEFEDVIKNYTSGESFIRKFKARKNIEGWENSPDFAPRVYADYFVKFANYISRRKFTPELNDARSQAVKQRTQYYGEEGDVGNSLLIDRLLNWMQDTQEYVLNPDIAWANFRAGVTMWYLGLSPKSALVNAFSVPLMTLPYLSQRHGDVRSTRILSQAYKDVGMSFKRREALSEEEWRVLEVLENLGVINESYATELAAVREGGTLVESTALGGAKSAFYKLRYASMLMFHKMEVLNRTVTAIAAYRAARGENLNADGYDPAALNFAKQTIQDTQNENAQWNRPQLMRGRKGVLTMFMSYSQNAIFQMLGGDPSWQRMLALQLTIAGMLGLPFAENLDDVIKWFSKRVFDSEVSLEQAVRQYLDDSLVRPEWILRGASFNFLGSGTNLHGSLSLGNMIPGLDALAMEGTFPERLANAASDVGGAGASVILDAMKALASDDPNTWKRFLMAGPQALKNVYEGTRMVTQGTVVDGAGDPILEVSGYEGAAKWLGFQATNVSREREKRFLQKQQVQYWLTRRRGVYNLFEFADSTGDPDHLDNAEKALDDYNEDVPDYQLRITKRDLRNALKARERNAARKEQGLPTSRRYEETYERVARGF
jgi:hypothetical protein